MIDLESALHSVGKGWAILIYGLYAAKPQDTEVIQVKEKFGGLRFYVGHSTPEFLDLIECAERASYCICENCGDRGYSTNVPKGSWMKTWCHKCWADARDSR